MADETELGNKVKVTLSISADALSDVDRVRGVASRSVFFELGARLLVVLLKVQAPTGPAVPTEGAAQ